MAKKDSSDGPSNLWRFIHWYPSKDDATEEFCEDYMTAVQKGSELVLQSLPNKRGAYMFVRLVFDGDLATGTWHETSSPTGPFEGAIYSGAGQLLANEDHTHMQGQWAGVGYDHKLKKPRVYTGRWELSSARQPIDT